MYYKSPNQSPNTIQPKLEKKIKNTISLPSLAYAQREQVDHLLKADKEKRIQKMKENYFKSDISHLKDKINEKWLIESNTNNLPANMNEVVKLAYSASETAEFLSNSIGNSHLSFIFSKAWTLPPENLNFESNSPKHMPTGRQGALNLKIWLDFMNQKYIPIIKDLVKSKESVNREILIKAWKGIYIVAMNEMRRQVSVQCIERGDLLQRITEGYEEVSEFSLENNSFAIETTKKNYEEKIFELTNSFASEIVILKARVETLEKEKEEWRHTKGEIVVKTKELIKYLEKLKKFEDKLKNKKGKPSYFWNYEEFINKIANEEDKKIPPNISEKLKNEISNSFKSLSSLKSEIATHEQRLKDLNLEINDKECMVAALNFEKELKETLTKQKKKTWNKNFVSESPVEKKIPSPIITNSPIDEFLCCETFFRVLLNKPKDRLVQKAKVSQGHIFKSLIVIYDRAIMQLNSYKITEVSNFRQLLYRQFVKTDTRKKNEKSLKNFFAGCLKFANFRRISVFFRLLGMGEWIFANNYSLKTFLFYLSIFLFMHNSSIGLLVFKDSANPIQYFPLSRALACFKDIQNILPGSSITKLENLTKSIAIPDPKQVNPLGMIELECFFENLLEEHEFLMKDIINNCSELFKAALNNKLKKELFLKLTQKLTQKNFYDLESESLKQSLNKVDEISLNDGIEIACKVCGFTSENIMSYLGDLTNLTIVEAKSLVQHKLALASCEISAKLLENIENTDIKHALVWMKILTE